MASRDARGRLARQIERLLGYPGVGPLAAAAIASNLGLPAGSLASLLEALVEEGRLTRTSDGRVTLPAQASRT